MDAFLEWIIKFAIKRLEASGKTDRAKLMAAYRSLGTVKIVVNAAYDRVGQILSEE